MKILYIAHTTGRDGSCIALMNIIEYMRKKNEIYVFMPKAIKSPSVLGEYCKKNNIQYSDKIYFDPLVYGDDKYFVRRFIRTCGRVYRHLKARKELVKIINKFKPDLVHTNSGVIDLALNYCLKLNIPHVWHLREYQDLDYNMSIFPSKKYWLKKIHKKGNYNIAITKGIFDYFHLRVCDKVIYDGPLDIKDDTKRNTIENKLNYFLFVSASIFSPGKGLFDALKAFDKFSKNNATYKLQCAGHIIQNDYYKQCMAYIRVNHLEGKVTFLGPKNQDEIYKLMHCAIAILVPSRFEGFGFVTTEAMYNNCLVIGRNTAGTKEQFDNGKEIIGKEIALRFDTWEDMAKQMEYCLHNNIRPMIENAKKVVLLLYTEEKSCSSLENFYKDILSHSS